MRGSRDPQLVMLTTLSTEDLIPTDHPIRRIRAVVDIVLGDLDRTFDAMYASGGRRSVPPEALLKATVLMAMYSIRSERAFCERLNYGRKAGERTQSVGAREVRRHHRLVRAEGA